MEFKNYYQVLGAKGEYLSGERELPAPPRAGHEPSTGELAEEPQLRDAEFRGLPVRVAYLWVPIGDCGAPALVPALAPLPLQVSHDSQLGTRFCVSLPPAASSSVISIA